jgi:hypothetical protein
MAPVFTAIMFSDSPSGDTFDAYSIENHKIVARKMPISQSGLKNVQTLMLKRSIEIDQRLAAYKVSRKGHEYQKY